MPPMFNLRLHTSHLAQFLCTTVSLFTSIRSIAYAVFIQTTHLSFDNVEDVVFWLLNDVRLGDVIDESVGACGFLATTGGLGLTSGFVGGRGLILGLGLSGGDIVR